MRDYIRENTVDADNQIKEGQMIFYLGEPDAKIRIAIVGNSITRHGIKMEIGWPRLCGMAASDEDHDYVHVLYKKLCEAGYSVHFMVSHLSHWEKNYDEAKLTDYSDIKEFKPDYFLFRLGENVPHEVTQEMMEKRIEELVNYISSSNTKSIFTTSFFPYPAIDNAIEAVAKKTNSDFIKINDLGQDDKMKAIGLFEHFGVSVHPGDLGMEHIATRIFNCINGHEEQ